MPYYVDNTPKKEDIKKFIEPKNVNHLVKSNIVAAVFEEESTPLPKFKGYLEEDEDHNYVVVTSTDDHCNTCTATSNMSPIQETDMTNSISGVIIVPEQMEPTQIDVIDIPEEVPPLRIELKMNPVTRLYVGSLSIVGLLILFRMLYKTK